MTYPGSTTTIHQRASDWQGAQLSGLQLSGNLLTLAAGQRSGTLTSAPLLLPAFDEVVPSWNSRTGTAGSVGLEVRAQVAGQWTPWYSFGRWSVGDDESLLHVVTSANVACGLYSGGPAALLTTCRTAVEQTGAPASNAPRPQQSPSSA